MSVHTKHTNEHPGDVKVVPDFLPGHEEIVFRSQTVEAKGQLNHGRKIKKD